MSSTQLRSIVGWTATGLLLGARRLKNLKFNSNYTTEVHSITVAITAPEDSADLTQAHSPGSDQPPGYEYDRFCPTWRLRRSGWCSGRNE